MQEVSIEAGPRHQAVRRFKTGMRPTMLDCILLADYFDLNPNEMLKLADWPALKVFSVCTENTEHLPPNAVDAALKISRIKKQSVRQKKRDLLLYEVWKKRVGIQTD